MSHARTVEFEGHEARKRFRHPGLLGRWFDGARARREARLLEVVAAAGVGAPRVLGLEREGRAWTVRMERVADAETLEERLERNEDAGALLRRVGAELARVEEAGVDLLDLHPGNVLVAPGDVTRWIDFHGARLAGPPDAARLERDLVRGASFLGELVPPAARLAAFAGWWNALPADRRASLGSPGPLLARVEAASVVHRARWVEEHLARWRRPSGRLVEGRADGRPALVAAHLTTAEREALARGELATVCAPLAAEALWLDVARAWEHRAAAMEPLARVPSGFLLGPARGPRAAVADERRRRLVAAGRADLAERLERFARSARSLRSD